MKIWTSWFVAFAIFPAFAVERGGPPGDGAYVVGGIGHEEIAQLIAESSRHTLWLITAAQGSGAYLSDALVRVTDAKGRRVFDRTLDGPWLLLDLMPGRYRVDVVFEGVTQQRAVTVRHDTVGRKLLFYFKTSADVLPAAQRSE